MTIGKDMKHSRYEGPRVTDRRRSLKKLVTGALIAPIAAVMIGQGVSSFLNRNPETYTIDCETFQGYHVERGEGYILVFDKETFKERVNSLRDPDYRVWADDIEKFGLKIGENYRVKVSDGYIVSAEKCEK